MFLCVAPCAMLLACVCGTLCSAARYHVLLSYYMEFSCGAAQKIDCLMGVLAGADYAQKIDCLLGVLAGADYARKIDCLLGVLAGADYAQKMILHRPTERTYRTDLLNG